VQWTVARVVFHTPAENFFPSSTPAHRAPRRTEHPGAPSTPAHRAPQPIEHPSPSSTPAHRAPQPIEHPSPSSTPAPAWADRGLFVASWPRWNARLSLDRGKMGRQTAILPRSRPRPGGIGFLFLSDYNSRSSSHHAINQGNIRVPGWAGSGKGGKFSLSQSARCAKPDTALRGWRVCLAHLILRDISQKHRET
jgi:hypothetical protein